MKWTDEEVEYVKNSMEKISYKEMAEKLNTTTNSIRQRIARIRKAAGYTKTKSASWTQQEKDYLRENYKTKSEQEIADYLGRSHSAVATMKRNMDFVRYDTPDPKIGDRFGELEVIEEAFYDYVVNSRSRLMRVKCICLVCETEYIAIVNHLRTGNTKSCGCNAKNLVHRDYSINKKFFDEWSEDMAYVLGFLTADGYVSKSRICIKLQARDVEVLEYIKKVMEYTGSIKSVMSSYTYKGEVKTKPQCVLEMHSYVIVNKLAEYGIIKAKSGKETLPDIPDGYLPHYLRGLSDGDGSFSWRKYKEYKKSYFKFFLSGSSVSFMEAVQARCGIIGRIDRSKVSKGVTWNLNHENSLKFAELIYSCEHNFALQRKKEKWAKALK